MNKIRNLDRTWVCLFSQTGNELFEVSKNLERFPDVIITDRVDFDGVNRDLLEAIQKNNIRLVQMTRPTVEDYRMNIPFGALVTLHGYLKILPPEICDEYQVYNGHPGDIVRYPELRGRDPQAKAVTLKLPSTGCVIHECTKDLDGGVVVARQSYYIKYLSPEDEIIFHWQHGRDINPNLEILTYALHDISVRMWTNFLEEKLVVNPIDFNNHPSTDLNTLVVLSFAGYF